MANTPQRVPLDCTSPRTEIQLGGYRVLARRLWVNVHFEQRQTGGRFLESCLLDTGAPLCVIPYQIHSDPANDLKWDRWTDPESDPVMTYNGIGCDIGRVSVWLPNPPRTAHGPFEIVAKFPRASSDTPNLPFILLGLNFFGDNSAGATFAYEMAGNTGSIEFRSY